MPVMNGCEATLCIRGKVPFIPSTKSKTCTSSTSTIHSTAINNADDNQSSYNIPYRLQQRRLSSFAAPFSLPDRFEKSSACIHELKPNYPINTSNSKSTSANNDYCIIPNLTHLVESCDKPAFDNNLSEPQFANLPKSSSLDTELLSSSQLLSPSFNSSSTLTTSSTSSSCSYPSSSLSYFEVLPENRTLPIIAVTSLSSPDDRDYYRSIGMIEVVNKPVVFPMELVDTVKKCLSGSSNNIPQPENEHVPRNILHTSTIQPKYEESIPFSHTQNTSPETSSSIAPEFDTVRAPGDFVALTARNGSILTEASPQQYQPQNHASLNSKQDRIFSDCSSPAPIMPLPVKSVLSYSASTTSLQSYSPTSDSTTVSISSCIMSPISPILFPSTKSMDPPLFDIESNDLISELDLNHYLHLNSCLVMDSQNAKLCETQNTSKSVAIPVPKRMNDIIWI